MRVNKWWKYLIAGSLVTTCVTSAPAAEVPPQAGVTANVTQTQFREPIDLRTYNANASPKNSREASDLCYQDVGCCKQGHWLIGGLEATFLWPDFHRNANNYTQVNGAGLAPQTRFASDATSVDHNLLIGPRVWLGVQGCRWGIIARYWNLADTASGVNPPIPTFNNSQLFATDQFRAYYADLEGVRSFCLGRWSTNASFGVRYASVDLANTISSTVISSLGEMSSASSTNRQGFDGTGITMGLWGSRQIRPCSCLNWFYSARASVLWGNSSAYALTSALTADTLGAAGSVDGALAKGVGDLFIGELQYGIQWERQLKCIPSRAFVRFAGEYQYWDASNSAGAYALSGAIAPRSSAYGLAASGPLLFDLVGFTIGAGLTY